MEDGARNEEGKVFLSPHSGLLPRSVPAKRGIRRRENLISDIITTFLRVRACVRASKREFKREREKERERERERETEKWNSQNEETRTEIEFCVRSSERRAN